MRGRKGDPEYMRKLNKSLVMNCIYFNEPISRVEISKLTGISKSTVSNITGDFLSDHSLSVCGRDDAHDVGGRCPELLNIKRDSKCFIGVNIGRTKISVILIDIFGEILDTAECPMPASTDFAVVMCNVNEGISKIRKTCSRLENGELLGIGVSVSGIVDSQNGIVVNSPNLRWNNAPIREEVERVQGIPVFVDNCTCCIARAYLLFNGKVRHSSFLCVNIAYGIGSAVVNNYKIFSGSKAGTSELGHITMDPKGAVCNCGKRGCLENYASGRAIAKIARDRIVAGEESLLKELAESDLNNVDAKLVAEAAERGDIMAQSILDDAAENLGIAISHAVNIMGIDVILLEGGVSRTKANFVEKVREAILNNSMKSMSNSIIIERGTMGQYAEPLGAAGLVINQLVGISFSE